MLPTLSSSVRIHGYENKGTIVLELTDRNTLGRHAKLEEEIKRDFGNGDPMTSKMINIPPAMMTKGTIVFALFPNGKYVRGDVLVTPKKKGQDKVLIQDMDTWAQDEIPLSHIYYLPPYYKGTPFLMQPCKLKGLEFWCVEELLKELSYCLPPFSNRAELKELEKNEEGDTVASLDVEVRLIEVRDKTQHTYRREYQDLGDMFRATIIKFTRIPKHFPRGLVIEKAHITHIDKDTTVWIRMYSLLAVKLCSIGQNPKRVKTSEEFNPTLGTDHPMSDFEYALFTQDQNLFLARFLEDKNFYRVKVMHYTEHTGVVTVQFLDFGNTVTIPVDDIIPSCFVDPILNLIDSQAFPSRLSGIQNYHNPEAACCLINYQRNQRFTVSAMAPKNVPVFDAYVMLDSTKDVKQPENWTYVNEYLVDKKLADPMPHGILPNDKPTFTKLKVNHGQMEQLIRVQDGHLPPIGLDLYSEKSKKEKWRLLSKPPQNQPIVEFELRGELVRVEVNKLQLSDNSEDTDTSSE